MHKFVTIGEVYMKVNIGTYSFGGIASYLGLGPTLLDNSTKCYSQLDCGWAQNGGCYPPSFIHTKKGLLFGSPFCCL